jgi:peptidoglycan/LPS O-acetylase OafA/YrhL
MKAPAARNAPPDFSRRIPQLDGLRGVAIAIVVLFHYSGYIVGFAPPAVIPLFRLASLGWSGVDLFFVLSGFLIGGILLDARGSSNYFRVFYRRRVCRILPLYFAFLVLFFTIAHFAAIPDLHTLLSPPIPWGLCVTFLQNVWMAIHNNFGPVGLNMTWSLAVEEQLYLTLPAAIWFVKPARLGWVLTGGIISAPLIRLGMFLLSPRSTIAITVLLPCRMDSLLLGVAAAYFLRQRGAWDFLLSHRRHLWTAIEILTAACAAFSLSPSRENPVTMLVGYDCFALLFTCVLVASLVDQGLARILCAKSLMALGSLAYCVYLIHQLVFGIVFVALRTATSNWAVVTIVSVTMTIGIAKISWEWFEKPFVNFGRRERYVHRISGPEVVKFDRAAHILTESAVEIKDAV